MEQFFGDYLKAGNPITSARDLEVMATTCKSVVVRRRLAENPNTPANVLEMLSTDENVDVRIEVAGNPAAPQWLRRRLCRDSSPTVRFAVAADPHTPLPLLRRLASDDHPYVQHQAKRTIEALELEIALSEAEFIPEAGEDHKLGVVLVAAGLLTQDQVDELLRMARESKLPLGQTIARARALPRDTITRALLLQSRLRRNGKR